MIFMTEKKLQAALQQALLQELPNILLTLEPKKQYILVVPPDLPLEQLQDAFEPFRGRQNLVVLQAQGVKLLEVS